MNLSTRPSENRAHSHVGSLRSPEGNSACGAGKADREAPAQGFGHVRYDGMTKPWGQGRAASGPRACRAPIPSAAQPRLSCTACRKRTETSGSSSSTPAARPPWSGRTPRPTTTFMAPLEPRRGPVQPPTKRAPGAPRATRAALPHPAGNLSNVHSAARCRPTAKTRRPPRPDRTPPRISAPRGPGRPCRFQTQKSTGRSAGCLRGSSADSGNAASADRRTRRKPPSTARSQKPRRDQRHVP